METSLSVFRNEKKYLISNSEVISIRQNLERILARDNYSKSSGYIVRSLYFDSINNIDYKSKLSGDEVRKKIRLRIYSTDSDKCKLEVKHKNGDLQHKVSIWITREDGYELAKCNYSVLTHYFKDSPETVSIYTTMVLGGYRPVVLVEYDRIAYTYPLYNTRITVDMNVRSSESNLDLFCDSPGYTVLLKEKSILEVKYNDKLMNFISRVLKQYNLTNCSVSKYCLGRKVFCDFEF